MIYVLIAGAVVALLLVWIVFQRRPSMVRSTENFRTTLDKISPEGSADVRHHPGMNSMSSGNDTDKEAAVSRADSRRYVKDLDVDHSDLNEERDWDETANEEHRPIPIDAPEADALDQERGAPQGDDEERR
jgi:hypothetical protein